MSIDFTVRELYNSSVSYMCVSGDCMGSSYWGAFDWDLLRKSIKAFRILLAGWIVAISLWIIDTFWDILCVISDWTYIQMRTWNLLVFFLWFSIIFCEWMKFFRGYFILKLESNVWVSTSSYGHRNIFSTFLNDVSN